ncbi:hypothetical protein [Erysipelothrix urinaevulpis]|nr:hypothetical protein [Erysipelothrix urinaevulpis]
MSEKANQKTSSIEDVGIESVESILKDIEDLKTKIKKSESHLSQEDMDTLRGKLNSILPIKGIKLFFSVFVVIAMVFMVITLIYTFWSHQKIIANLNELSVMSRLVNEGLLTLNVPVINQQLTRMIQELNFFGYLVLFTLVFSLILTGIVSLTSFFQSKKTNTEVIEHEH